MQIEELFQKRRSEHQRQIFRYFKYIFNDHFVVALIFLLGALMFQYAKWVDHLPQTPHPSAWLWIWVIGMTLLIRFGHLATYLNEADIVFLLPAEHAMGNYMKLAYRYSLLLPLGTLAVALIASFPFLQAVHGVTWPILGVIYLTLVLMKAIDLKVQSENGHHYTTIDRHVLSFGMSLADVSLLSFGILERPVGALLLTGGFYVAMSYFLRPFEAGRRWDWEQLLQSEANRQQQIQAVLGLFVDVQKGEQTVRRRRWLDLTLPAFNRTRSVFQGLYARSFVREGAWFGLWMRLSVIGAILLFFLPNHPLSWGIMGLLLLLSGIQLLPLSRTYQRHPLLQIYPLDPSTKQPAFQQLLAKLLLLEWGLFVVIVVGRFFGDWPYILISLGIMLLVIGAFVGLYLPHRLSKKR
ncbi:MAG: ABC transporter permease [Aerococcus sp.]|nr:ABC transporter permease [Aerococcus sp.]